MKEKREIKEIKITTAGPGGWEEYGDIHYLSIPLSEEQILAIASETCEYIDRNRNQYFYRATNEELFQFGFRLYEKGIRIKGIN